MRLFTTIAGLRCYLDLQKSERQKEESIASLNFGVSVGFVPTMGALHEGHLSLIRRARQENDLVVVSIFVNPLQFGPNEDFQKYPRPLERDRTLCEHAGVDVIFAPSASELYGTTASEKQGVTQVIPPTVMTSGLCGRSRLGHFEGVTTIVTKLLNLVQPDRAYFGQKDAQQLAVLQRMVADLNVPVKIVPCPIVREADGLAMSSRNQYLSAEERSKAIVLYRSLKRAERIFCQGNRDRHDLISAVKDEMAMTPKIQLEYVELVDPVTMAPLEQVEEAGLLAIAARLGTTRLIDNVVLRNRQPIVAIDGPAGAGKSTVARRVANQLGLLYLDTGAMYRAVTWLVLRSGIPVEDEAAIAELVTQCEIRLIHAHSSPSDSSTPNPQSPIPQVWINGQNVTEAIRSHEVTANVSAVSAQPAVRCELVNQQRSYGRQGGIVLDGRDIGTCVFPDAELKIFLTASVQERARRRHHDLKHQGQPEVSLEELEEALYERDRKDSSRAIAPLRKADDAIEIQTDALTIEEVVEAIVQLCRGLGVGD